MAIDKRHLGRRYGPYQFTVGVEHIRDFAAATGGGVPGRVFGTPPGDAHPWTWDAKAAARSPYGAIVAPPGFATTFAIQPFSAACSDPELGLNVLRLLHSGQDLELLAPVRAGDLLTTTGEITRLQERAGMDFIDVSTTTVNQRGEVVVRATWTAIIRG